jgi:hypothetical protein
MLPLQEETMSPKFLKRTGGAAGGTILVVLLILAFRMVHVEWSYGHLEQTAAKVTTAAELQTWATNLLATNAAQGTLRRTNLGNGFPVRLCKLCPELGPSVTVNTEFDPPWVSIIWSSGMRGAAGFEIGPTNFSGFQPSGHAWAPGVYFFRR